MVAASAALLAYQSYQSNAVLPGMAASLLTIGFVVLVRYHDTVERERKLVDAKIKINQDELVFLDGTTTIFDGGTKYKNAHHPYSDDLDIFGDHSLYQTLNRTGTEPGRMALANTLMHEKEHEAIRANQQAISELAPAVSWRQEFLANAMIEPDSEASFHQLLAWVEKKPVEIMPFVRILSYVFPILTLTCLGGYFFTPLPHFGQLSLLLMLANLGVLGLYARHIQDELLPATGIEKMLKQYAHLLARIEEHSFEADRLQFLRSQLTTGPTRASASIHQLSLLFGRMEHVTNAFASPLLNGLLLYHLHVLAGLTRWRSTHSKHIQEWLSVIGAVETINSLANFSHTHPSFVFPEINEAFEISFEALGHPLIPKSKAVTNSIDFNPHRFFILTGSNMSGKSTFLRTLGVNMVLAGVGAPVFASKAKVHPLPLLVSMRLTDSLSDSESYFYAEVKRLKSIMDQLDHSPCFVLLDEILRGTNSDDKRSGTIEVIRQLAKKQAYGGIATHDLEVCKVVEEFKQTVTNKRFEVAIVNDELVFDYALKDGICENKSASFIMKKMGVI